MNLLPGRLMYKFLYRKRQWTIISYSPSPCHSCFHRSPSTHLLFPGWKVPVYLFVPHMEDISCLWLPLLSFLKTFLVLLQPYWRCGGREGRKVSEVEDHNQNAGVHGFYSNMMLSGLIPIPFLIHPGIQFAFLRATKWGTDSFTILFIITTRFCLLVVVVQAPSPFLQFFLLLTFAVFFLKVTKKYEKVIFSCDIAKKSASQHNLTSCKNSFLCTGLACAVSRPYLWDSHQICLRFRSFGGENKRHHFTLHFTKARERGDQLFPPTRQQQLLWGWKKKNPKTLDLIIAQHFMVNSEKKRQVTNQDCLKFSWCCLEEDVSPVVVRYWGKVVI